MTDPVTADKFAIHAAAREGQLPIVESLLQANPKLAQSRDDDDRVPIHWAISNNRKPIVDLLVQTKDFDPDVKDGLGWTPLMMASSLKDGDELVTLLLSKGAETTAMNSSNQTALHFAVSKTNLDVARLLLSHKASARARDKRGQYPLHRAAAVGSVPMCQLLLDNKSPLNATDISGLTALHHGKQGLTMWPDLTLALPHLAIAEGHGDTAMLLLRAGAETDKRDVDGQLAIDLAPDKKIRDYILQTAEREGISLA